MSTIDNNKPSYIAIVDDNPTDIMVASLLIQKEGHQAHGFDNYNNLVKFLRRELEHIKLILLDNEMPGLSGMDILKRLKKEPLLKEIPVIMVTGDSAPATVYKAVTGGAINYLVKPLNPQAFEEKIRKIVQPVAVKPKESSKPTEMPFQNRIDLKFPALLATIGENSVTIKTTYPVGKSASFVIDTPFLKSSGLEQLHLTVESCKEIGNGYHLRCSIEKMSNEDQLKIQKIYSSLIQNHAASAS